MTSEERQYVPNLDELALRLQISEAEQPYTGLVLFGKSGRVYAMSDIVLNHVAFTAQSVEFIIAIHNQIKELIEKLNEVEKEGEKIESNKRTRQSKKADDTTGDA